MTKHVLVINQYYPPDIASTGHIAAAICDELIKRQATVTAIVGQPSYSPDSADAPAYETDGAMTIRRVPMGRQRGRRRFLVRMSGYLRFLFGAWVEARRCEAPDVIVTFHNPPLVGNLGARLARRFAVPFVYVVQDIHPDILVRTGWPGLPRWAIAIWRRLNRAALGAADLTITLSPPMKRYLVRNYGLRETSVCAIPLWAKPDFEHLPTDAETKTAARRQLGLDVGPEELLVLYAGNMGVMHPVETLLRAAASVKDLPIRFILVGDGTRRRGLEVLAHELALENVRFLPYQGSVMFEALVQAADVCTVVLESGLEELCLPSRSMTFMSAGRPILAVMESTAPLAEDLRRFGGGWSATTPEGVARILRDAAVGRTDLRKASESARSIFQKQYRADVLVGQYADAILSQRCAGPEPA